ncbi:hypothetical protein LSH36_137g02026 [Paralvinella palmiformis]|uniref:MaoC-like domain-containing protein n=1 Tax=Paralvinella palmiformis TaxID=53620 RepID=A0AAD9JW82_9ANNE|nr:hypothetical protein LSH36_137g02026 [Paralvinella palmiformis]
MTIFPRCVRFVLNTRNFCGSSSVPLLEIGSKSKITKSFSSNDVQLFANLTHDRNPIHLDEDFVKTTRFKKKVVHGILCVGLLSGVLGTVFPGPGSIMLSCEMRYPAPLYINEEVTAEVIVRNIQGRKVTFDTKCIVESTGKIVCEGMAQLLVPRNRLSATNGHR